MNAPTRPRPPLDPGFAPPILALRAYREEARRSRQTVPLVLALERDGGRVSRYETAVRDDRTPDTLRYVECLVKFLLWARGAFRIVVGGPPPLAEHIRSVYSPSGARAFDVAMMERVYEKPFEVAGAAPADVPAEREAQARIGGHLDGCRIGFDLGASDYKVAAVRDGKVLYTEEFPWDPRLQADPAYHYDHLNSGLRKAAMFLPRVDAIGGSSAGLIVDNRVMVASLFRAVPDSAFAGARDLFRRIAREWKVPVEVANDGDVTALAGSLSLRVNGILGIALGSSEAGGYLDPAGHMTGWLTELAFAPVDLQPGAPADEWSGDRGVGAVYFSQQAVNRLLAPAGIAVPEAMSVPDRLKVVQDRMAAGDPRAARIYETIGDYLGYAIPWYAEFYAMEHVLILGRVTSGAGGDILLDRARRVLDAVFPEAAQRIRLHAPDEKSKRVGQAVAAASLPMVRNNGGTCA